jgi:hypothetical protein
LFTNASLERRAPRHDQDPDASCDGQPLNLSSISGNHEQGFGHITFQPLGERFGIHHRDHQDQFLLHLGIGCRGHFGPERSGEVRNGCEHAAGVKEPMGRRAKEPVHLENRHQATAHPFRVKHGQSTHVFLFHYTQRFDQGRARPETDELALHHVSNLRRHIRDKLRRRDAEGAEHEINSVIRIATAGRHRLGRPGAPFELGVADGRADRVRIRITMADDEELAWIHSTGRPSVESAPSCSKQNDGKQSARAGILNSPDRF